MSVHLASRVWRNRIWCRVSHKMGSCAIRFMVGSWPHRLIKVGPVGSCMYYCCRLISAAQLGLYLLFGSGFSHESKCETEKAMTLHSSTLAWKIPWMEEPGRLQSMGSLRVGHDWVTSLSLFTFLHGRRKRQPTPVFLPGESQGRGSLVGCRLWGRTETDTTEAT